MTEQKHKDLVTRSDVELTLQTDKGSDAILKSFEVKDFTNPGDNYACIVSSVVVQYERMGRSHETSYVIKMNPLRGGTFEEMSNAVFEREIGFYAVILPLLEGELKDCQETKLKFARYYHSVATKGKEIIYLEDLRKSGYKMNSRFKAMDKAHTALIIKELARYHAASHLMLTKMTINRKNFETKFPFMKNLMDIMGGSETKVSLEKIYSHAMQNTADLVKDIPGYEYVDKFVKSKKDSIFSTMSEFHYSDVDNAFCCLSHGDCWNNNFLFRYNSEGVPVECRLVDLQAVNLSTPGMDLNHMLYTSVDGKTRRDNMAAFLDGYYATFASVLAGKSKPMAVPFTLSQLRKEFHHKQMLGLLMAMMAVPTILLKPEDAPAIEDFFSDDIEEAMAKMAEKTRALMKTSDNLGPRLLQTFDEFKENGLLSTNNVAEIIARFRGVLKEN